MENEEGTMTSSVGPSYFYEDEVFRISKNGEVEFGMVTENWEMYSSDEPDEDEESEPDKVPHGHVAVTWHPKGKDEVIQEAKVYLGDRSLMPGDVVRRLIAGKDTQRGYCRSVRVSADVQVVGSKKVIPSVAATTLLPVQKLQSEVAVYLDSWIGVVRDVKYLLNLKFSDNSACTVDSEALLDQFEDIRRSSDGFGASDIFYPGQRLRGQMKHLKEANWSYSSDDLKRAKDRKIVTVLVTDVQPISLNIQWQWQTPGAHGEGSTGLIDSKCPSDTVDGEDLKRIKCLNLFESCTVQLGDISYYTPNSKDVIIEKMEWKKKLSDLNLFNRLINQTGLQNNVRKQISTDINLDSVMDTEKNGHSEMMEENEDENPAGEAKNNKSVKEIPSSQSITSSTTKKLVPKVCTRALRKKKLKKAPQQHPATQVNSEAQTVVETLHTKSVVDVVWQDGTYEEGLMSIDLYPIHHLDDHEFFPGDFVVLADSNDFRKYGVIQNMDHSGINAILKTGFKGRVAVVKWFEAYSFIGEQKPKELEETEMSVYDIKDHPDFRFRPGTIVIRVANMQDLQYPAGQILDNYPDGQVRVWWANGVITPCWPQDLFRLGDYDSDEGEIWDDGARQSDTEDGGEEDDENEDANSDSSWETETEEEVTEVDPSQRYETIRRLIEYIQKTLVCTREAIIASSNVSMSDDNAAGVASPIVKLGGFDERGLTKKLLLIYKDCQYLDKIMETKFFEVEDLKMWYNENESASAKSRRMIQQISRLFDVPLKRIDPTEEDRKEMLSPQDLELKSSGNSSTKLPSRRDSTDEIACASGTLLYELCSIILSKLVEAHSEYEKRFGGFKNEHASATSLLGDAKTQIEPFTDSLGKQFLKRQLNKVGGNRVHHELAFKFVLSVVDNMCNTSSTGGNDGTSKKEPSSSEPVDPPILTERVNGEYPCKKEGRNNSTDAEASSEIDIQVLAALAESESKNFTMIDSAPDTHRYRVTAFQPQNQRQFIKTVQKEVASLRESLPDGIFVKAFEDRMDLYSVMIKGPEKTPYEDGIFLFDVQLPAAYPTVPPTVHYIAFCTDRLNPNLYEDGKVCVSLLGTWSGKGTEVWTSSSCLLQLFVSIQGLILGPEPYYNEAGYDKQRGTQQGGENSRMYNENVLIKLVQSMSRMVANPPSPWEKEAIQHIKLHGPRLIERCGSWLALSEARSNDNAVELPGFSLLPVSKGFSITLKKTLASFGKLLTSL